MHWNWNSTTEEIWKELKYLEVKEHLLKNGWFNKEVKKECKQFTQTNENKNTLIQKLWDTAKAVLMGKYIAVQTSLKN